MVGRVQNRARTAHPKGPEPSSPPSSRLSSSLSLPRFSPPSSRSVGIGIVIGSPAAVVRMADEEVSDPKALLEERSKAKCVYQWYEYKKCVKRIEDDETGQKHCTGQYFDYWKCIDKNIAFLGIIIVPLVLRCLQSELCCWVQPVQWRQLMADKRPLAIQFQLQLWNVKSRDQFNKRRASFSGALLGITEFPVRYSHV
ncbi:hypothetical protein GUJ93_ZPchr0006g45806 [Zizania palustris]|uniref:Complex III subunit VI n=1 Tax=Zizania palustris TaxID=103762 RepID=A0A8J5SF27_ZIZPA|nr:hypothetical protein GUJ93_ZPchr0006g45806 [Zizania palustris]